MVYLHHTAAPAAGASKEALIRMKRVSHLKIIALCLIGALCFSLPAGADETFSKYSTIFYDAFDTVIQLIGYASSQEMFDQAAQLSKEMLTHYHQLFNQYDEYPGVVNVRTLNQKAKDGPVQVSQDLFDLLALCQRLQREYSSDYVNISMGSVLSLWHDAREEGLEDPANAKLPDMELLKAASEHTDIQSLVLDPEALTVYYADPLLQLDLGAIAKGYAAEKVRKALLESPMKSFILNAGGNVCLGEPPMDGRPSWSVGIQNPDDLNGYTDILYLANMNVVTSGDYQRYYLVDGNRYSHLISPQTLMPANQFRSVTVIGPDGGICDFLSTWLFIASYEEGRKLIDGLSDIEAYWIMSDGTVQMTEGMKPYARSTRNAQ